MEKSKYEPPKVISLSEDDGEPTGCLGGSITGLCCVDWWGVD